MKRVIVYHERRKRIKADGLIFLMLSAPIMGVLFWLNFWIAHHG